MATTEYLVLFRGDSTDGPEGYAPLGKLYPAASADAAVRAAAEFEDTDGSYVAIPARSWKPRVVKVQKRASFDKTGGQS